MTLWFSEDTRRMATDYALTSIRFGILLVQGALDLMRWAEEALRPVGDAEAPEAEQEPEPEARAERPASPAAAEAARRAPPAVEPAGAVPAVPIEQSVTPESVICLEDGKAFRSLKRHLHAAHGLTPAEYRAKWQLSADHPLVAPRSAAARSRAAKQSRLGAGGKRSDGRARKSTA